MTKKDLFTILFLLNIVVLILYLPVFPVVAMIYALAFDPIFSRLGGLVYPIRIGLIIVYFIAPIITLFIFYSKQKKYQIADYDEKLEKLPQIENTNLAEIVSPKIQEKEWDVDLKGIREQAKIQQEIEKIPKVFEKLENQKNNPHKKLQITLVVSICLIALFTFLGRKLPASGLLFPILGTFAIVALFVSIFLLVKSVIVINKEAMKKWVYQNQIKIPGVSNVEYLNWKASQQLYTTTFLKKISLQGRNLSGFYVDDTVIFDYKGKKVELLNFFFSSENSTSSTFAYPDSSEHYLCLATQNPDQAKGETVVWSSKKWEFNLPEKVDTESLEFNKIFKIVATSQLEARLHLPTERMQDLLNLNANLELGQTIFYFKEDRLYIIFEIPKNPLELDLKRPKEQQDISNSINKDLQMCLEIFDHFWLDRR